MDPTIHLLLHSIRAAELRREAAGYAMRPRRPPIRTQLGWRLVELELRLVQQRPAQTARTA
ncbi:hypothetical protein [Streptomyces sp. NPDC020681]|uniref:hypothetical protein n=1 Tax=Streptomyces sp. NPDC020681 TaxID=3365083 RepID=UPI0037B6889F